MYNVIAIFQPDDVGMQRINGHHDDSDDSKIITATSKGMASETPRAKEFLLKMLDLVDRYWNGSKSLHKHAKFKGQIVVQRSNWYWNASN